MYVLLTLGVLKPTPPNVSNYCLLAHCDISRVPGKGVAKTENGLIFAHGEPLGKVDPDDRPRSHYKSL